MKEWISRSQPATSPPAGLAERLSISPKFLEILWNRGFTTSAAIDDFLSPTLKKLSRPALWPQIPEAAAFLVDELMKGKKIAVWGDYDVDGITSTTLALEVLETHGFAPTYHLPDRRSEGYGLNSNGLAELADRGYNLLLTVDCGICENENIEYANSRGMAVVICDHHLPSEKLPPAARIVDPRISHAGLWPCADLAGVGVCFYLMAEVNRLLAPMTGKRYKMDSALDLVALGTLADVMPLVGENRILARGGLATMAASGRPGLTALKKVSNFDISSPISGEQAVFRLAPRINAAGRMGNPEQALQLLRTKDDVAANRLAETLDRLNEERKTEENRIFEEARAMAQQLGQKQKFFSLVLYGEDWHPGIIGIVASRMVEEFACPAIILCRDGDTIKGSGRTFGDFDLYDGLSRVGDCLLGFGGHKQAAGVRLLPEKLPIFRRRFDELAGKLNAAKPYRQILEIDGPLDPALATRLDFLNELALMGPFGPGNEEPVFESPPLMVRRIRRFGVNDNHARLTVSAGARSWEAKAMRMGALFSDDIVNKEIILAYTPRLDMYRGLPSIFLNIRDWHF